MSYTFDNAYVTIQVEEIVAPVSLPVLEPEKQLTYIPFPAESVKKLKLTGSFKNPSQFSKIEVLAPGPIQRLMSYSGSGLPFPCAQVAFHQTPNYIDLTRPVDGTTTAPTDFETVFEYPNSYYAVDHRTLIPPSLFCAMTPVESTTPIYVRFELPNPNPLKSLTYRPRFSQGPDFYAAKADLIGVPENQEAYLRAIGPLKATYGLA